MKYEKKFLPQDQQEQLSEAQLQSSQTVHEFATPEDVLRFDAKQTTVPDGVAQRLGRSLERQPCPPRPWWKRLF
jgi:hypothetical protein